MKKNSRLVRRILRLIERSEDLATKSEDQKLDESTRIVCTEESLNNYWGYYVGGERRVRRFPKQSWEVLSDKA